MQLRVQSYKGIFVAQNIFYKSEKYTNFVVGILYFVG